MTQKYIGILVTPSVYNGISDGETSYEELPFYEEAATELQMVPCYFRLKDIDPNKDQLKAIIKQNNGKYKLKEVPKPVVIHNRIFTKTNFAKEKIKQLQETGILIFNENNRYTKLEIHDILLKDQELIPHIPETRVCNKENVMFMMEKYQELIFKPNSGSLGFGIIKLTQITDQKWEMSFVQNDLVKSVMFSNLWPKKLKQVASDSKWIVQERIQLASSRERPFDLRVSVQKNGTGNWQVSGIVGKVADKGSFITNVAQGGACYPLNELLKDLPHLNYQQVNRDIEHLSLKVVEQIENNIPHLADLGLDIAITNEGKPMFIECNGRDLRVTFRNANMFEEWKQTHITPMKYAEYLYKTILD